MPVHPENEAEQMQLLVSAIPALERVTSTLADSDAVKTATLHNITPQLAHLANVLAEEQEKQEKGLNKLAADERLERIRKLAAEQRNEFDALDFVGELGFGSGRALWGSEEFHSKVLVWLLDPRGSHGLGDRFLTLFLLQAGVLAVGHPQEWAATEVTREWAHDVERQSGRVDILIVNPIQQILCAIENKVFADEHGDQLTRYRKALESSFPTFTKYLVFLTPRGTSPAREEEKQQWTPLAYSKVFGTVQQIVNNHEIPARMGVRGFLNHYVTTLRRNVMPETSLSQLARKTYLEHREAIDLIIANSQIGCPKPDSGSGKPSSSNRSGCWTRKIEGTFDFVRKTGIGMMQRRQKAGGLQRPTLCCASSSRSLATFPLFNLHFRQRMRQMNS